MLTDRRNVVVVADEAHRSQYGFSEALDAEGRLKSGLAKHMRDALPNATYLGFTGTPIESTDKSTRAVFGDYIDVYDLTRAVEDGATVTDLLRVAPGQGQLSTPRPARALDDAGRRDHRDSRRRRRDHGQVQVGAARGDRRRRASGST